MENWKAVVGYEGLYEVSDLGRVRTVGVMKDGNLIVLPTPKVRKTQLNAYGYPQLMLKRKGTKPILRRVHTLVLQSFVGPAPSPSHVCAHGDGDRTNAILSNLRWATQAENLADMDLHGTKRLGEDHPTSSITNAQAAAIKAFPKIRGSGEIIGDLFSMKRNPVHSLRSGKTYNSILVEDYKDNKDFHAALDSIYEAVYHKRWSMCHFIGKRRTP